MSDTSSDEIPKDECAKSLFEPQDGLKRAIGVKLAVIARQIRQRFDQCVDQDGLTGGKWSVVAAVARNPGATQRTIAAVLEVTEVTAGQLIDRLCADGYLERRKHPKDRRAYAVYITDASKPLLGKLGALAREHEDQAFAGLEQSDLVKLDQYLDVVARNVASSRLRHDEEKKSRALSPDA